MITDERTRPKPITPDSVCANCAYAKQKFRESCYCTHYGITIGYGKIDCRGWKREQVSQPENRA
jgi:hypothetical protein